MSEVLAYLLLGSNIGDRATHLHQAQKELATTAGEIVAASAFYETAAWGLEDQPAFLNQVLAIRTFLAAPALLAACLATEQQAGQGAKAGVQGPVPHGPGAHGLLQPEPKPMVEAFRVSAFWLMGRLSQGVVTILPSLKRRSMVSSQTLRPPSSTCT